MLFTTSWDDGHHLDLKLAELLQRYAVQGTFFVSPSHPTASPSLTREELKRLAGTMEIGAHTMTHPDLTAIPLDTAREEIITSKQWVEEVTGKQCTMFCYPKGRWNPALRNVVKEAGFAGARTTEAFRFSADDPWAMPVSLHLYPFPLRPVWNRRCVSPLTNALHGTAGMGIRPWEYLRWPSFARALFRHAQQTKQPWFHLWGHSWEIERYGMWGFLESFLRDIVSRPGVQCVPTSALLHAHPPSQ